MDNNEELLIIPLNLDDGKVLDCYVISVFEEGVNEYIALMPTEEVVENESQIMIMRYVTIGEDEISLEMIDDDDEWERVAEKFDELMQEE